MLYDEGDIATFTGEVCLDETLNAVNVLMEIRKALDNSLIIVILDRDIDFVADVVQSFITINDGIAPTWNTMGNTGEFYFKITLSHADLEGDTVDKEYFDVRDITKPDAPIDVRINYPPRVPIELKVTGL